MKPVLTHPWNLSVEQASSLQQRFSPEVIKEDKLGSVKLIAGVDVAYAKSSDQLIAAVVILNANTLALLEEVTVADKVRFPYVPGLFSFRELPPLLQAFERLQRTPDLVVCDAQGYAHPRRFGLACHLGVMFDVPTIGCGKSRLLGRHEECPVERGSSVSLKDNNEVIGHVLRTQTGVNPVYVSIGHRISLATACAWVLKLAPKYRLPETTRQADQAVRFRAKKSYEK